MKRKVPITNSESVQTTTKKLDVVKSSASCSTNNNLERENDCDDYADRIFNYLGEAYSKQTPSTLSQVPPSDKEIKPFLCAFCPYFARDIHEFQTHIAKHTEKNFRCLLCNCMYKYRRDCVTHMKRKHANTVTGSISQYIQKINSTTTTQPTSTPSNLFVEPKRYGCPYCSLMTKSTSSIYKHQSRKHASFPKIVHKYSTDDPNTRSLVAILKQKSIKKPILRTVEDEQLGKSQSPEESLNSNDPSNISSSSSLVHNHPEPFPLVNRHRCAASKHIIAHNITSSNGHPSKLFQCCLCGYQAHHRSNVVRHVKKIHTIDQDESKSLTNPQSDETSEKLIIDHDEKKPTYSFNTTVQAPLIPNKTTENDQSNKPYADIHLSINIFLPKKNFDRTLSDYTSSDDNSDEDIAKPSNQPSGSLYKPHKCRRCFYRSNWKTDMLHHIRLKHHINHATKSDYISMDFDSALRTFSDYEKTFGKVLKNRLLLPKIDYIDCSWEDLQSKLIQPNQQCLSSSSIEQAT